MLYSEIIAVCSQIHTKLTNTLCGQNVECRTYRAVNTLRLSYKNQPVNAVQWNNRGLFRDLYKLIHKLCGQNAEFLNVVHIVETLYWKSQNSPKICVFENWSLWQFTHHAVPVVRPPAVHCDVPSCLCVVWLGPSQWCAGNIYRLESGRGQQK